MPREEVGAGEQAAPPVNPADQAEALQARLDEVICVPLLDRNPAGAMQLIGNCFTSCDGTAMRQFVVSATGGVRCAICCDNDAPFVHFEAAYYAGIDRCIARGIPRFEAGAQGEHKLLRGFLPTKTHSCHWFSHPGLSRAVGEAIHHEEIVTSHRMRALAEYGPFKASSPG